MRTLTEVLNGIGNITLKGDSNCLIEGMALDSRAVKPGFLFAALPGTAQDGSRFITSAIANGAKVVLCEKLPAEADQNVVWIIAENPSETLGLMASNYYGNPSKSLKVVGITGTNGKTTTATLLYRLFKELGFKVGLLSTVCNYIDNKQVHATHTTPDPLQIQMLMSEMVEVGCQYCFMEVSSHAVAQNRISGIKFDGGVFSNLTHDHLDYHKTFAGYRDAKKKFFDDLGPDAFAITNLDDKNGMFMLQNTAARKLTYAAKMMADYKVKVIESHFDGMLINIDGHEVWTHFVGNFNAYNLLAVYGAAVSLGVDREEALRIISMLRPVDGRFETFKSGTGIYAVVDYAHTPDAIKNVLSAINGVRTGDETVFTVVGAGGDRDKTKRPEMAFEAATASDKVILTSDNPRSEDPEVIISEMQIGVPADKTRNVLSITNRKEAIRTACMMAKPGDIILIAGKGHEDYQEIKGVKHHFDDREVISEIFNAINQN
ncbi:MAG: UDP-N-acetylmuramoyl-L-alanyl-D-glutamate--2,6-diaminopimelate ligase [Mariniphaga sp.]